MTNKYDDIPTTLKPDANGVPSKDAVADVTHFVLGDETSSGWLSSESKDLTSSARLPNNFTHFGSRNMSVQSIRETLSDFNVRRSDNGWHGKNEYTIQAGTWSPWRQWEDCETSHPEKHVLALRGFFDFIHNSNANVRHYTYTPLGSSYPASTLPPSVPGVDYTYPAEMIASNYTGGKSLGDKDNKITISILPSANKFWDNLSGLKSFDGGAQSYQTRVMLSRTAYALNQSRDMIDHFARLRLAKQTDSTLTGDNLEVAARAIPVGDKKLEAMSFEYRNAITHTQNNMSELFSDPAKFKLFATNQTEGSIRQEVAKQMLGEYQTIIETMGDPALRKTAGLEFLKQEKFTPDLMMKMMYCEATQGCFTAGSKENPINTGWFFTTQLSGLSVNRVTELLDPSEPTKANNLVTSLRFMSANMFDLSAQALFNPDNAGAHRSEMDIRLLDLTAMQQTLLHPEKSENPERAYYLSAAYQGAFVQPLSAAAKKNTAVQKLCTALAAFNFSATPETFDKIGEHLKRGTYSPEMQALGLTQKDLTEIRTLLISKGATTVNEGQIEGLINGLKDITVKHITDKKAPFTYTSLAQVGANVSIRKSSSEVEYATLDGNGKPQFVGKITQGNQQFAYNDAASHATSFNTTRALLNETVRHIATNEAPKQNPLAEHPIFITANFERPNTGNPIQVLAPFGENQKSAKKALGVTSPFTQIATFPKLLATIQ